MCHCVPAGGCRVLFEEKTNLIGTRENVADVIMSQVVMEALASRPPVTERCIVGIEPTA